MALSEHRIRGRNAVAADGIHRHGERRVEAVAAWWIPGNAATRLPCRNAAAPAQRVTRRSCRLMNGRQIHEHDCQIRRKFSAKLRPMRLNPRTGCSTASA